MRQGGRADEGGRGRGLAAGNAAKEAQVTAGEPDLTAELDTAEMIAMGADFPLTCQHCRNSPATHLLVGDLRIDLGAGLRSEQLVCKPCGAGSFRWAKDADHLYLYALTPVEVPGEH